MIITHDVRNLDINADELAERIENIFTANNQLIINFDALPEALEKQSGAYMKSFNKVSQSKIVLELVSATLFIRILGNRMVEVTLDDHIFLVAINDTHEPYFEAKLAIKLVKLMNQQLK